MLQHRFVTQRAALTTAPRTKVVIHARASVDPLAISDGIWRQGKVLPIHSEGDLNKILTEQKHRMAVLMCKSSHCRPCKKFMATYYKFATRFSDCVLLDIIGDESPETRKMMLPDAKANKSAMRYAIQMDRKVKVTPTFFIYRDGQQVLSLTGTANGQLRDAILDRLKAAEAGREWHEPEVSADSDDDE